jgi:hypothetical protein
MDWIVQQRREFLGPWVALEGSRLVAHGNDPAVLIAQARSQGVERPLVVPIQEERSASIGGWL